MRELAALLCLGFVAFLFWRDYKRDADRISWAPFFWMAIAGSRFVSHWLSLRGPVTVEAFAEGSPIDRAVFFCLIAWGMVVLSRRSIDWSQLLSQNQWLAAYLLYCLASMMWTAEPAILAKRWAKDLGNPVMALVLLTERRPYDAITTTARRLAFLLLPVSVLFIRYYPELGRGYTNDGTPMYSGIADQKNTLGVSCLIVGMCYASTFVTTRRLVDRYDFVMVVMLAWLLYMANSKTALMCLFVALGIFACSGLSVIRRAPSRLIPAVVWTIGLYVAADTLFQVQDHVLAWLGRNPTLTNRTEVWAVLHTFESNAFVGAGFMSFWTGERMAAIWTAIGGPLNQAHNGYLEQYLNLGYIGVGFIIALATAAILSIRKQLATEYPFAVLRLCFLVTALLYNYTEASFYGINNMWVLFLTASITASGVCHPERLALPLRPVRSVTPRRLPQRRRASVPSGPLGDLSRTGDIRPRRPYRRPVVRRGTSA